MNAIKFFILCSGIIFTCPTLAMKALEKKQAKVNEISKTSQSLKSNAQDPISIANELGSRRLIIIFDPKKDEGDRCLHPDRTHENLNATNVRQIETSLQIRADAAILVSRWTWDFLVNLKKGNCDRSNELNTLALSLQDLDIKPQGWKAYSSKDEAMLLFVPILDSNKTYWEKTNRTNKDQVSEGELLLGIKINELVEVPDPFKLPMTDHKKTTSDDLSQYLKEILVNHNDLKGKYSESSLNYWDIYLSGHGGSTTPPQIAGMSVNSFSKTLDFLNLFIQTRSFFYDTCYSGGNMQEPYQFEQAEKEKRNKEFNFIIISATSFDLVSISYTPNLREYFNGLDDYFANNKTTSFYSTGDKLTDAIRWLSRSILWQNDYLAKAPAVRFPHTGWFKIRDIASHEFLLNNSAIMNAINKGKKEIFIKENMSAILVESQYVPIPMVIDGNNIPVIIPLDFKKDHYFKEIKLSKAQLNDLFSMLQKTYLKIQDKYQQNKIIGKIYISKLEILVNKKDFLNIFNRRTEFKESSIAQDNFDESKPVVFTNVIIDLGLFSPEGKNIDKILRFNFTLDNIQKYTSNNPKWPAEIILNMRNDSELPQSMKIEEPKPVIKFSPPAEIGGKPQIVSNTIAEDK